MDKLQQEKEEEEEEEEGNGNIKSGMFLLSLLSA